MIMDKRLINEIEHGKFLIKKGAGEIWNWETPAGKLRWKRRVNMLSFSLRSDQSVLEIGCGTGYFTKELIKTGACITSIDISPNLIEEAINKIHSKNIKFKIENAYEMSFDNNSFDAVIGSSVLHHLDVDKALQEIYRVLKPGGTICFTEPNMMNPQILIQKNIPAVKRKLGDSPDETAFFKWALRKKLKKYLFREVKVVPFDFLHPLTPPYLINFIEKVSYFLERAPLLKEIAGSLYIYAKKV